MKKKILAMATIMLVLLGIMFLIPNKVLAEKGPSDESSWIRFKKSSESSYRYVYKPNTVDNSALGGATYDKSTNTLTLTNVQDENMYLETNEMGEDFKLKLIGTNKLSHIHIWGFGYGGCITITGNGSLDVIGTNWDNAITVLAEKGSGGVTIESTATVNLYSNTNAITVLDTSWTNPTTAINLPNTQYITTTQYKLLPTSQVINYEQESYIIDVYQSLRAYRPSEYASTFTLFNYSKDDQFAYAGTHYQSITKSGVKYEDVWGIFKFKKIGDEYYPTSGTGWDYYEIVEDKDLTSKGYTNTETKISTYYPNGPESLEIAKDEKGNKYCFQENIYYSNGVQTTETTIYDIGNTVSINGENVNILTINKTIDGTVKDAGLEKIWEKGYVFGNVTTTEKDILIQPMSTLININTGKITLAQTYIKYTGKELKPSVTVVCDGTTLKQGTDYTITYSNNKEIGTATVTITGKGKYTGKVTKQFYIVSKTAKSLGDITVQATTSDVTYTGGKITRGITVKDGTKTLVKGTDYTVSYKNNLDVGTATITVTGKSNYYGVVTKTFKIVPKSISSLTVVVDTSDVLYNGYEITKNVTVKDGNTVLTQGRDFNVTHKNNIKVGTATLTITGKGNYTGSVTRSFKIIQKIVKDISKTSISAATSNVVYTGSAITRGITIKDGATTLAKSKDYVVSYKNNVNIGKATITITGRGNYTGTVTKTFRIVPNEPQKLLVKSITQSSVTLIWNAPSTKVAGYRVYAYNESKKQWDLKATTTDTTTTISGLSAGNKSKYKVCGYIKFGSEICEGAYTKEIEATTIPATPKIKSLSPTDNKSTKQLKLVWTACTNAQGYQVGVWTSRSKAWSNENSLTTTRVVSGLVSDKLTYQYKVRSFVKANGKTYYSPWSSISSIIY